MVSSVMAGMEGYVKLGWVAFRYGWQVWQYEVSSDKARFGRLGGFRHDEICCVTIGQARWIILRILSRGKL